MKTPSITASQGDYTAVNDAFASNPQNNPLGGIWIFPDSNGAPRTIKYVQYKPTSAATWTQGAALFYTDYTRTIVTNKNSEAATYLVSTCAAIHSFAGLSLNATAPTVTNFIWIQVAGYNANITMPASTTAGDKLVCSNAIGTSPTDNVLVRVAGGTTVGMIEALLAIIFVTTAAASGGGLGAGWIRGTLGIY